MSSKKSKASSHWKRNAKSGGEFPAVIAALFAPAAQTAPTPTAARTPIQPIVTVQKPSAPPGPSARREEPPAPEPSARPPARPVTSRQPSSPAPSRPSSRPVTSRQPSSPAPTRSSARPSVLRPQTIAPPSEPTPVAPPRPPEPLVETTPASTPSTLHTSRDAGLQELEAEANKFTFDIMKDAKLYKLFYDEVQKRRKPIKKKGIFKNIFRKNKEDDKLCEKFYESQVFIIENAGNLKKLLNMKTNKFLELKASMFENNITCLKNIENEYIYWSIPNEIITLNNSAFLERFKITQLQREEKELHMKNLVTLFKNLTVIYIYLLLCVSHNNIALPVLKENFNKLTDNIIINLLNTIQKILLKVLEKSSFERNIENNKKIKLDLEKERDALFPQNSSQQDKVNLLKSNKSLQLKYKYKYITLRIKSIEKYLEAIERTLENKKIELNIELDKYSKYLEEYNKHIENIINEIDKFNKEASGELEEFHGGTSSYDQLTVKELRKMCKTRKIQYSGLKKKELVRVLKNGTMKVY